MTKEQAIKKYNLTKQEVDFMGDKYDHEVYTAEIEQNGIKTCYCLEEDLLCKEHGETVYFLHIEKWNYNKLKKDGTPSCTNKIIEITQGCPCDTCKHNNTAWGTCDLQSFDYCVSKAQNWDEIYKHCPQRKQGV